MPASARLWNRLYAGAFTGLDFKGLDFVGLKSRFGVRSFGDAISEFFIGESFSFMGDVRRFVGLKQEVH